MVLKQCPLAAMKTMLTVARGILVLALALSIGACNAGFGRSSDNDLQSLSVSGGTLTPSFSRTETEYTMLVGGSTDDVEVVAVVVSETATLKVNGQETASGVTVVVPLNISRNEVEIEVTAENELRKIYTVVVTKSDQVSSDATLRSLTLDNVPLEESFSADQLSYRSDVNFLVNQTAVSLEKGSQFAQASVETQTNNLSDNELSAPIFLNDGETNKIVVSVNAEDDSTTSRYEVEVNRAQRDALALTTFVKASNPDNDDGFAQALAARDGLFVVGAPAEQSAVFDNQNNNAVVNAGAAYVFERSGSVWSQRDYLKAHDNIIAEGDRFGAGLASAGDWIAVGAPGRNDEAGIVYLFSRSGSEWVANGSLTPADSAAGNAFGDVLAMSSWVEPGRVESEFLFVAAPGHSSGQGAVYVYRHDEGVWNLIATQTAGDGAGGDAFGSALSVNTHSASLEYAVGAPGKDSDRGAAYIFRKDGGGSGVWAQVDTVEANNPESGDRFGASVGLGGDVLAVGAPLEGSDINGVFNFNMNGTFLDNNNLAQSGAVYVYSRTTISPNFAVQAYLKADRDESSEFGAALSLSGGMLAVGAPKDRSGAQGIGVDNNESDLENSGAVHVFSLTDITWAKEVFAKSSLTDEQDEFGKSLVLVGGELFVGVPGENSGTAGVDVTVDESEPNSGAVFIIQ